MRTISRAQYRRVALLALVVAGVLALGGCLARNGSGDAQPTTGPSAAAVPLTASPVDEVLASAAPLASHAAASTEVSQEVSSLVQATVPAGGFVDVPLVFEGTEGASVMVTSNDKLVTAVIGTTTLKPLGIPSVHSLAAALTRPADQSVRLSTTATKPAIVGIMVAILTDRHLDIEAEPFVAQGSQLDLTITLSMLAPGDTPVAEFVDPQAIRTPIALTPAGSGRWVASVSPGVAGRNQVFASVAGPRPRETSAQVEVGHGASNISSTFSESLTDKNGDGLAETLVLTPSVTVATAGPYTLVGRLVDSSGREVSNGRASATLVAGATHPMALEFDATYIYKTGHPGPYRLVELTLFNEGSGLQIDAELASADETAPYDLKVFQHDRISFDPDASTGKAVDTNGDGLMDQWRVTGTISVEDPGSYTLVSGLVAAHNHFVAQAKETYAFAPGSNPFTLDFSGPSIIATGEAGPYTLWLPMVYVADNSIPRPSALAVP